MLVFTNFQQTQDQMKLMGMFLCLKVHFCFQNKYVRNKNVNHKMASISMKLWFSVLSYLSFRSMNPENIHVGIRAVWEKPTKSPERNRVSPRPTLLKASLHSVILLTCWSLRHRALRGLQVSHYSPNTSLPGPWHTGAQSSINLFYTGANCENGTHLKQHNFHRRKLFKTNSSLWTEHPRVSCTGTMVVQSLIKLTAEVRKQLQV